MHRYRCGVSGLSRREVAVDSLAQCRFVASETPIPRTGTRARALNIIQGGLILRSSKPELPPKYIAAGAAVAGQIDLEGGVEAAIDLLRNIASGDTFVIADRSFRFHIGSSPGAFFQMLHSAGMNDGRRLSSIQTSGGRKGDLFETAAIDWALMGNPYPLAGLWDLGAEVGITVSTGESSSFEFTALNVVEFVNTSALSGEQATIDVLSAKTLEPSKNGIGYKMFHDKKLVRRGFVPGGQCAWVADEHFLTTRCLIEAPAGSVIHAFASYDGATQQQHYILDASALPNGRYVVYSAFDHDLSKLTDMVLEPERRKDPQR